MKFLRSFISIYIFAIRLALLHIIRGKIRRRLYLLVRPIDLWRVFEFPIVLEYLVPQHGEQILDVSSPKLFSLYTATKSHSKVYAMDIYDDGGLTISEFYKSMTGINNLFLLIGDVRKLPFDDQTFDKVFSISVLEHIFPEYGGDAIALKEIARVLKPSGVVIVTLPFTKQSYSEYKNEDVYERKQKLEGGKIFYQRRYDNDSFKRLLADVNEFEVEQQEFICERLFYLQGKELCNIISEGNKIKRLLLAPLYPLFAFIFIKRSSIPISSSEFFGACLKLRKRS
jgi:ubiquinone/menaquinone biosynthesis C-methylase UbiE